MTINRKDFLASLKRAAILSTYDYQGIKMDIKKENVVISKATPQLGEVEEGVVCTYNGKATTIGFNPNYLIDVVKNIEEDSVSFEFFGPDKPAVLRKANYLYLVLPIKI